MKQTIIQFINDLRLNQNIYSYDEAATKQAIILRLLHILGWDTFSAEEVSPEYTVKSDRVDFSLRINETNKVFIEAKRVNKDLEKEQDQLLKYSFQEGIKISILTNGIQWWLYLPLNEGSWEQRKFYTIDLIQQQPENIAEKLIDFLMKENISTGIALKNAELIYKSRQKTRIIKDTLHKAWNKIVSVPDELLIELMSETTESICGYKPEMEIVEKFISKHKDRLHISEPKAKRVKPTTLKGKQKKGKTLPFKYSIEDHLNYTQLESVKTCVNELRKKIKAISDDIDERPTKYHINFKSTVIFFHIYVQIKQYWVGVKLPRPEVEKTFPDLDVRPHKDEVFTQIRCNENTDIDQLVSLAEQAYENTL
jgi:hypothetical protein